MNLHGLASARVEIRHEPPAPTMTMLQLVQILTRILLLVALTCVSEVRADEGDNAPEIPANEGGSAFDVLIPEDVAAIVGTLIPGFLIYEYPGAWVGVEVGWRTSTHTHLVVNAGISAIWAEGTTRYFSPLGVSLRIFPWEQGLWFQFGLGTMPFVEHISVVLPERTVSTTDFGATLAAKLQIGFSFAEWHVGVGSDFNLLPLDFYEKYDGSETLPWDNTFMLWVGRQVWTGRDQ